MTHLFNTVFRERDAIKYKSIKAAKIFQSAFQYNYRKLKCINIQCLHVSVIYLKCGLELFSEKEFQ